MIRAFKLAGVVLAVLTVSAAAGCQPHTESAGSPTRKPTAGNASAGADPTSVSPSADGSAGWHSDLTVTSDTLYLGRGQLPVPEVDKTTAPRAGELMLRVQCDRGHFSPTFTVDGNDQPTSFTCTGKVVQQLLVPVKKGSSIAIRPQGDPGTNFATELTIVKSTVQP